VITRHGIVDVLVHEDRAKKQNGVWATPITILALCGHKIPVVRAGPERATKETVKDLEFSKDVPLCEKCKAMGAI
jgi:hypothetical protein